MCKVQLLFAVMDGAVSLLSFVTLLLVLPSASADVCFWSGSCLNKWMGSCGTGRVKVDQSNDCQGLCSQTQYSCSPFSTHIQCCNEETPIASDECARCGNRVEVGNHWMCCSDCTEAKVINHETKAGFCRSGAQLSIQPKAREVFKWRSHAWSECSAICGNEVRRRTVRCVGSLEYSPHLLYYVNDSKCDPLRMPLKEEACSHKPCANNVIMHHKGTKHHRHRRGRLPIWAKVIFFGMTSVATSGLAFGGYFLYRRRKDEIANHGFVYVMLDSYS